MKKRKLVGLFIVGIVGGSLSVLATGSLTGCPNAVNAVVSDIPDAVAEAACVEKDWGMPIAQIAKDCTKQDEQIAIDIVAGLETLLESRGAKPTTEYLADARVSQKVIAALAKDSGK